MRRLSLIGAAGVVILAVLVIYSAHAGYFGLYLDRQIDPIAVATLTLTVLIALWLQYYLAARMTTRRAEKDLLIENTRDVIAALKGCREALNACHEVRKVTPEAAQSIKLLFRRLSNAAEILEAALEMSDCKKLAKDVSAIKTGCFNYKAAATRAPFPSQPYNAGDISDQEQTYRALNKLLMQLLFDINRHE